MISPPSNLNGYFSHSFEEVEEDLFLDRIVAVGRGSRRLPNPGHTILRLLLYPVLIEIQC